MPVVRVEQLCVEISEKVIVSDISLTIPEGSIVGLIGQNGAGKSTTVRSILGLQKWASGELWFDNQTVNPVDPSWKRLLGYIPEEPLLYDELTAMEHMRWIAVGYGLSPRDWRQKAEYLLTDMQLHDVMHETPDTFSKGMRQRLQIAMARLHDAEILVADEPFYGLDPAGVKFLKQFLLDHKHEKKSVLLATHSLAIAEEICDLYFVFYKGHVLASGTLADLARAFDLSPEASLETTFLAIVDGVKGNSEFVEGSV